MTVQAPYQGHLRPFALQGFALLLRRLVEFDSDQKRRARDGFCLMLRRLVGQAPQLRRDTLAALRKPKERPTCPGPWRSSSASYCDRTGRSIVWRCSHTNKPSHLTPQTCDKSDCYHDQPRVSRKRGRRVFGSIGGAPLAAMVFTFPHQLRVLGPVQLIPLRRELGRLVRAWTAKRWGVDVGLVVNFHACGDVCEGCGLRKQPKGQPLSRTGRCVRCGAAPVWKPHFDVVMPCVGLAGRVGSRQAVKRIPFHVRSADLAALKLAWSDLVRQVATVAGVELPSKVRAQLAAGLGVVDYRFRLTRAKKLHRCRYSMRNFAAWASALPGTLTRYQRFGLAAGNPLFAARVTENGVRRRLTPEEAERYRDSVQRWREAVRGNLEPAKPVLCKCCKHEPAPCDFYDSASMRNRVDLLAYGHLVLYTDGDDDPDPS